MNSLGESEWVDPSATVEVAPDALFQDSEIVVGPQAKLVVEAGVVVRGYSVKLGPGASLSIGHDSHVERQDRWQPTIVVEDGRAELGHHNVFNASLVVRWGGHLHVGDYTAIKQGTEIRCEDSLYIGDFVMISYECLVWDTNTHEILDVGDRRAQTVQSFPAIGLELAKPRTQPVYIGSDAWIGQRAVILKGAHVGPAAVVGVAAVVTGVVPDGALAVGNPMQIARGRVRRDN